MLKRRWIIYYRRPAGTSRLALRHFSEKCAVSPFGLNGRQGYKICNIANYTDIGEKEGKNIMKKAKYTKAPRDIAKAKVYAATGPCKDIAAENC